MGEYNYEHFTPELMRSDDFHAFRNVRCVGDEAPDGVVVDASTAEEVQLSSLWRQKHVVIEFVSMT